jgi:RimJ/RimL family protein N-acetyltransferase
VLVTTTRLRLEPVTAHHVDDLLTLYADPEVAHWTGPWTESLIRQWAHDMEQRWLRDRAGKWVAYRRDDGALVGRGGLSRTVIDGEPRLELGWALLREHRGHGYAAEIGRAGLEYAFSELDADDVVAFTEVHNSASRAVMVRLGMTLRGQIHRRGLVEGRDGLHDDAPFALYAIARDEHAALSTGSS